MIVKKNWSNNFADFRSKTIIQLVLGGLWSWSISVHLSLVEALENVIGNLGEHFLGEGSQEFPGDVQTSEDGSDIIRVLYSHKSPDHP